MSELFIEELDGPVQVDVKRFYLPHDLTSICPQCGEEVSFEQGYVSYPTFNEPFEIHFYHEWSGEDDDQWEEHEWSHDIIMRLHIEEA